MKNTVIVSCTLIYKGSKQATLKALMLLHAKMITAVRMKTRNVLVRRVILTSRTNRAVLVNTSVLRTKLLGGVDFVSRRVHRTARNARKMEIVVPEKRTSRTLSTRPAAVLRISVFLFRTKDGACGAFLEKVLPTLPPHRRMIHTIVVSAPLMALDALVHRDTLMFLTPPAVKVETNALRCKS